jgi:hypothetical protein
MTKYSDSRDEFTASRREPYDDDVIVRVRLRPSTLARLAVGLELAHLRLDAVPYHDNTYDLYTETEREQPELGGAECHGVKGSPTLETWRSNHPGYSS